jgi:hypothetical protein
LLAGVSRSLGSKVSGQGQVLPFALVVHLKAHVILR